ncbi:heterogeneous nuclear ribonucleoprotein U-like protein 1 isoform X2 [Neltuma alba]|uniref:heterogeneous nuclear ribonucleoprotein U-like protein 1 isoform X2 n=1 Tax=Neltuma alba TaxID=207710 RepID=UPI0010A2DDFD|nr:heterogeneous nuclear ribonucleoprotein U-like protein 1 isoform X2 [Prosopis alba]
MACPKRHLPTEALPDPKKARSEHVAPATPANPEMPQRVVLNPADCDLDFTIGNNGLFGSALHDQGFAYCWSGARANIGINGGKYCFGCKVVSVQPVDMEDTTADQQHVCRLGISRGDDMVGNLGESRNSFGYGGTGKFSNSGKFSDYGEKFGNGDTIVCCIDLESKPLASLGFSKNGKWLGTAFQFDAGPLGLEVVDSPQKALLWESALFPHVLLKNVVVQMQFSVEDGLVPIEGFKPWAYAIGERSMVIGPSFSDIRDCEVIMMVGLPASGKTTWAEKWIREHPEKRYVLLGTNLVLDQMKVPGLLRKNNYGERFDRLMDRATEIFNTLMSRAAKIPRNYIIDQTNVFKSARKRKLKPFADFSKIAVVVFPEPEELRLRTSKRFKEMGKEVPPDAVNNMLENFVLPKSKDMPAADEFFDQVIFVELNREDSQKYLDQMKQDIASMSNKLSALPCGGSCQSSIRSPLQNSGSFGGSGSYCRNSYGPNSSSTYRMAGQINEASQSTRLLGSSGVYPSGENLHLPRAAGDFERVGGPYGKPCIEGNMGFPSSISDPYRWGMHEPSPVVHARTTFYYNTHGGPYGDLGDSRPDLFSSRTSAPAFYALSPTTYGSLSSYGAPNSRPPHGNFPGNMRYYGGHDTHHPRYY